ncbi:MAG: hypothetical protein CME62_03460 [Halobacteriovoraceae bacterium]|nr:hypothetical protein [Halobacteriovoraceae bacterium]|tara:strand:- start:48031 stop:48714 length:684 start_codon:yes stop_codon:yes gene_type:complete
MSTTPEQTQGQGPSVEETLEKTDFGQLINENKKPILIIAAIVVVLIIGYAIFAQMQKAQQKERLEDVFKVESSVFIPFLEDKSEASDYRAKLNGIDAEYIGEPNLVPSFLQALNKLKEKDSLTSADAETAQKWLDNIDKRSELYLLTGLRVAVLHENLGQNEKAIAVLEDLKGKNYGVLTDRVHFELGRLYVAQGNKEKAQENLQKVIDSKEQNQFKSMATIYMSEL